MSVSLTSAHVVEVRICARIDVVLTARVQQRRSELISSEDESVRVVDDVLISPRVHAETVQVTPITARTAATTAQALADAARHVAVESSSAMSLDQSDLDFVSDSASDDEHEPAAATAPATPAAAADDSMRVVVWSVGEGTNAPRTSPSPPTTTSTSTSASGKAALSLSNGAGAVSTTTTTTPSSSITTPTKPITATTASSFKARIKAFGRRGANSTM
jgi:hypothetical protein